MAPYFNRIDWAISGKHCTVNFGNKDAVEADLHRMEWYEVVVGSIYDPTTARMKPSKKWELKWGDLLVGQFEDEPTIKEYIVRCAYGVRQEILVPSEFLYDAGITYQSMTIWVDTWSEKKTGESKYNLYNGVAGVHPPVNRIIRLATRSKAAQERYEREQAYQLKKLRHKIEPRVSEDAPRLITVDGDWEDTDWNARCYQQLCYGPLKQPDDEDCAYTLIFPNFYRGRRTRSRAQTA